MKKSTIKELRRISMSIPKELLNNLMKEQSVAPSIIEIMDKALVDPDVSEKDKERFRHIKDSGYLNRKEMVVDFEVQKKIDEYLDKEIKTAIKLGRIPDPKKDEDLKEFRRSEERRVGKECRL